MDNKELIRFLNTLRFYVPPYWKDRIDVVIEKLGGKVKINPYKEGKIDSTIT